MAAGESKTGLLVGLRLRLSAGGDTGSYPGNQPLGNNNCRRTNLSQTGYVVTQEFSQLIMFLKSLRVFSLPGEKNVVLSYLANNLTSG